MTGQGAPERDWAGPRARGGTQRKPRQHGLRERTRPAAFAAAARGWRAMAAGLASAGLALAAGSGTAVARTATHRPAPAPAPRPAPAASGWHAATKPDVHLFAVTCPSWSSCLAVGYYLFKPRNWEGGLLLSGPA